MPDFPLKEIPSSPVILDILTTRGVSSDSTRVDCFYRVSNDVFNFIKSGDGYVTHYELSLMINDKDGFQVLGETFRDSAVVKDDVATRSGYSRVQLFATTLPPGKYVMEMKIFDIESSDQLDFSRKFTAPNYYRAGLSISDIQFAGMIMSEPSLDGGKPRLNVVPNLRRVYGESMTSLYIYYEIYSTADADTRKPLRVRHRIKSPTSREIFVEEEELERQGATGVYSRQFDTKDFAQGTYTIEVTVRDEALKKSTQIEGEFYVNWQYLLPLTSSKNYSDIIEQLRYIASGDEQKKLKKLKKAGSDEQQAELAAFWKRRDPTPETEENEYMEIFYRRIDYANKHFTAALGQGWESDTGRVYILFGPPDEVEQYSFEAGTQPYQIWHYTGVNRNFIFMDFDGYGNYELYQVY